MNRLFALFILLLVFSFGNAQVYISEFQASNTVIFDTTTGNANDWIELHNPTNENINLTGWFLSDNTKKPGKWQFPSGTTIKANSYLILWCDKEDEGLHTNFGLSSDGETISLANADTTIIDSLSFGEQTTNISQGRTSLENSALVYFIEATPNASNSPSANQIAYTASPNLNNSGGFFDAAQSISINSSSQVFYTTDGSTPTSISTLYSKPIDISKTTCLKVVAIEEGKFPSEVITQTYFINENSTLPVVSLTGNPDYFWDDYIGIYTKGKNGITAWGVTANYWRRNWEREMNFEFFEEGELKWSSGIGVELNGQLRHMVQKSLKLNARGKYGASTINHQFFNDREQESYNSLLLRNGGYDEYKSTYLRDGLMHTIAGSIGVDVQSYQPVSLFINGEYFGLYNMREKQDVEYLERHFGESDVDIIEFQVGKVVEEGTGESWDVFYNNLINISPKDDKAWENIETNIDVDEFIDYTLAQVYYANSDWPSNNMKLWKAQNKNGKWRALFFGAEAGMGHWYWTGAKWNALNHITDTISNEWNKEKEVTLIFNKLLANKKFKEKFISRMDVLINSTFSETQVLSVLDSLSNNVRAEMERQIKQWPDCDTLLEMESVCRVKSMSEWDDQLNGLKDFISERPAYVIQHFKEHFNLLGRSKLTVQTNDSTYGQFEINRSLFTQTFTGEFFDSIPITIRAIPKAGYRFVEWKGLHNYYADSINIQLGKDLALEAVFEATGESIIPQEITSNYTLNTENSPYVASGNITVHEGATLNIEKGVVIKSSTKTNFIIHGKIVANGTENNPIYFIPNIDTKSNDWGALNFINTTDTSTLHYVVIEKATHGLDKNENIAAISLQNGLLKIDHLTLTNTFEQPIFGRNSYVVLENSTIQSKITGDLINVKKGELYIRNCTFLGNDKPDTDAIDFDGIENGEVINCNIYGFYGSNSDAIDLGEQSKNILIKDNVIFSCTDKGVSIGQASTGILINNIIYACSQGVGIKDADSYATIDKNTLDNNDYGVACFQKNENRGGGSANITNTIISNSGTSSLYIDEYGAANINYSLSNKETLTGDNNIKAEPNFKNIRIADYNLKDNSPAIDAGDPTSSKDADNSITDIGAIPLYTIDDKDYKNVILNEVMASNSVTITDENGAFEDWIEIFNPNDYSVNIAGYSLSDNAAQPQLSILSDTTPQKTIVPPMGHIVFWADKDIEEGGNHLAFKLSSEGETVTLYSSTQEGIEKLDEIIYEAVVSDHSFGRKEDAHTTWIPFASSTPYQSNQNNDYFFTTTPNVKIHFQQEYSYTFMTNSNLLSFEVSGLPEGLQFYDYEDGTGEISGTVLDSNMHGFYQIDIAAYNNIYKVENQSYQLDLTLPEGDYLNFTIHPNPVLQGAKLSFGTYVKNAEISLQSIDGKRVLYENTSGMELDLPSAILPGVYFLKIQDQDRSILTRIVIQ